LVSIVPLSMLDDSSLFEFFFVFCKPRRLHPRLRRSSKMARHKPAHK
jgi:hypothetical protein